VNNSGRTFIQDITLDGFGHVTAITSATDADTFTGTVTSVNLTAGDAITVSGGPVTTSGSITVNHADTSTQASVNNSGSVYIQDITLDTYGHVTAITSTTVPASTPTTEQVTTATAGLTAGGVGTYAFLSRITTNFGWNDTIAGSSLYRAAALTMFSGGHRWEDLARFSAVGTDATPDGGVVAGTWRSLGWSSNNTAGTPGSRVAGMGSLFVRIS
jgi:hypothetical protein